MRNTPTLRHNTAFTITVIFIMFYIFGCEPKEPPVDAGLNKKLNFNLAEYQKILKEYFSTGSSIIVDSSIYYLDTLRHFYSARNFKPVFVKSFEKKTFIDSLLNLLNNAYEHGLSPIRYHASIIKNEFNVATDNSTNNVERYKHLALAELLVSDAVLKYSTHLRYGVLDPKNIFLESYYLPIPDSSQQDLFQPLDQSHLIKYLYDIQPKSKRYKQLQASLKQFESYKMLNWEKIPINIKKLKFGDVDSSLIQISERLSVLGFRNAKVVEQNNIGIYDSVFTDNIKAFQKANGLIDDGIISKATIEKLNVSPAEYINKIKANLERIRWFDYSDSSRYVLVNIPEFKLHVIENEKELFNITVCTGRKRYANFPAQYLTYKNSKNWRHKPEDWETPILYSRISHLILNPTWTVPSSIMREEIASKLRRDSTYLTKANFRVYKNGSMIDPGEVKAAELNSGSIPYTIIQNPGAGNALGKIKFMFDNPFGVYLHDTPTRAPFKYANRAVSHGCVRVEKPFQLAEYILADNSKWTIDYLKIEVGAKVDNKNIIEEFKQKRSELRKDASYGQTTEVKLDNNIPLFIDYYTAWVDENGIVNFRDDVYRHDKTILENLARTH